MAFPLLERALERISNRYLLVVLAARRSRQINRGSPPQVDSKRKKGSSVALEEIIAGKVYPKPEEKVEAEAPQASSTEA